MSIFPSLKGLRDIVMSHVGSDVTETSEPLIAKVLGRFDSILGSPNNNGVDHKTVPIKRNVSTNWALLLKDTIDFLQSNKGLLQDVQSQTFRVDQDIRLLIEVIHSKITKGGLDDEYLIERFIQLATSLPDGSAIQVKLTGALLKNLYDSLLHPPMSYLGDQFQYRTADGSNNNVLQPTLGMAGTAYARSVTPLTQGRVYPDPNEVFEKLLARRGAPKEQPCKVSSLLFYLATIIIHDIFRTGDGSKDSAHPDFNVSSTSSYLDLSPLYGNNTEEQEAVRTMKDGMLKPDTFSDVRILGFPPGVSALLVAFNRFHNYVAEQLKRINEGGRFGLDPRLTPEEAERKVDKDLFNTARLVTCGLYVNIILSDYIRTIINLNYAPDSDWVLDPREAFSEEFGNNEFPVATGNQVSVEFNLVYRWHTTVSPKDEAWSLDFFKKLFPGQDVSGLSLREFFTGLAAWKNEVVAKKPEARTFADLKRDDSGHFNSWDLASLMAEATQDISAAFGAHQVPPVLKPVVLLGITQARGWRVGTLNELRKFLGLKVHKTFEDINPDPETQRAMRELYKHPDFVEMYPGILFEQTKVPVCPGSGLCAGFTTIRAILSDAVTLVRGDRFYTLDCTIGIN